MELGPAKAGDPVSIVEAERLRRQRTGRSGEENSPRRSAGRTYIRLSLLAAIALIAGSWFFILAEEGYRLTELFSVVTWSELKLFAAQFAGIGNPKAAFRDPQAWKRALELTYGTLLMSILAIGFAGIGMLLTVIPAARTAADGTLTLNRSWVNRSIYGLVRALYVFTRAVPELIWALLVVFIFKPGLLPGALALGLHNFGVLGKLCAEVVEDVDLRPARAIRSAGGSTAQMLLYAILPAVLPKFVTYLLYRWEVIIRTTIVVGFVAAGGLGYQFRLSMSWFHYTDVALLLFCYVGLVFAVDMLSGLLRRMAR